MRRLHILKKTKTMKDILIIVLLAVLITLFVSDRYVRCRKTREADQLMQDLLDEIVYYNDQHQGI